MNRSAICTIMCLIVLLAVWPLWGFADTESKQQRILMAEMPLYLENHLDSAHIEGPNIPEDVPEPVEWRFNEPQPEWKPLKPIPAEVEAVKPVQIEDALRLPLTAKNRIITSNHRSFLTGVIYVALPDWDIKDWAYVEILARTRDPMKLIGLGFNYMEEPPEGFLIPQYSPGAGADFVTDGAIQMYRLSLDTRKRDWQGPWTHLMIGCLSEEDAEAAAIDILSVRVVPAPYVDVPVGVRYEVRDNIPERTIFIHTPGKLEYRLRVPQAGRLDIGLGIQEKDTPVTFEVTAGPEGENTMTLLEETYADREHWALRSVDLSAWAGKTISLSLKADAEHTATVAFWAAPTVSGRKQTERPLASTLVWDTQSLFVNEVDLRTKASWKVVTYPYPEEYFFKGDAVIENEHQFCVFWSEKGRVLLYSKADLNEKKVELLPLKLKQEQARITTYRILQNSGDDAALEVSFTDTEKEEKLPVIFSFSKKEIIEIKPTENMKGISLLSPIEYGIVPDFIADDLILDPKDYPSTNTLHIPSSNLFLGLLRGRNHMLVVTWPKGEQQMRLILADQQEEPRLIESVDFENDGKSIYLALLEAPGIWHKEELNPSYLEKDIIIDWKRPFPAKWITQLHEAGVSTTYRFRTSRWRISRGIIGAYIYPVWFEGENAVFRLGKKIPPQGESIIYYLEGKGTPVSVSTPVDIMKETLGWQTYGTILDLPGRQRRIPYRRPKEMGGLVTCDLTLRELEPIFREGQEVEKKEFVEEIVDDLVFFVTRIRGRINEYQDFANDMMAFLKRKRKSHPDLKPFLDSMETITQEILQEYSVQRENMKTLSFVDELARKTKALTQKKDPNNLPTMLDLGEKWRGIGGAQDGLLASLHMMTRKLFQDAGYGCINQPEAMEITKEIRSRCRECLRNPYGFEIWPDY